MSDIREAMTRIRGKEPTAEQIAQIQAIAHALDIPQNDAMMPILAALETYHGIFAETPQRMVSASNKAAKNAAETAAAQATEQVSKAVADLIPTITQATAAQMAKAVRQNNAHKSFLGIGIAALVLAAAFGLGWINGAGLFAALQVKTLTNAEFWERVTPALTTGVIMSLLVIFGAWLVYTDEDDNLTKRGWIGMFAIATAAAVWFFML